MAADSNDGRDCTRTEGGVKALLSQEEVYKLCVLAVINQCCLFIDLYIYITSYKVYDKYIKSVNLYGSRL